MGALSLKIKDIKKKQTPEILFHNRSDYISHSHAHIPKTIRLSRHERRRQLVGCIVMILKKMGLTNSSLTFLSKINQRHKTETVKKGKKCLTQYHTSPDFQCNSWYYYLIFKVLNFVITLSIYRSQVYLLSSSVNSSFIASISAFKGINESFENRASFSFAKKSSCKSLKRRSISLIWADAVALSWPIRSCRDCLCCAKAPTLQSE